MVAIMIGHGFCSDMIYMCKGTKSYQTHMHILMDDLSIMTNFEIGLLVCKSEDDWEYNKNVMGTEANRLLTPP